MSTLYTFWDTAISYKTESVHFLVGLLNSATKDTSAVSDMGSLFKDCDAFNQPIGSWNTSAVRDARDMFGGTKVFNQNISDWDT